MIRPGELLCLLGTLVSAVGIAGEFSARPGRDGAVYYPGECVEILYSGTAVPERAVVSDWRDAEVRSIALVGTNGTVRLTEEDLGGRIGAYRVSFYGIGSGGRTARLGNVRFARLLSRKVTPQRWIGTNMHNVWRYPGMLMIDLMSAAGIGMVRCGQEWDSMECKRGEPMHVNGNFEEVVDYAVARGMAFDWVLFRANEGYDNPLDPEAFARYVAFVADRFKGRIDTYEIWNEPHNFDFYHYYRKIYNYGGNRMDRRWMRHFVDFTRRTDDELAKRGISSVLVGSEDWWDMLKIMLDMGLAKPDNVIAIHPYDHKQPIPERCGFFFKDGGKAVRAYTRAHGGTERIAISEVGWTTYEAGTNATHAFVGNYPVSSFAEQAYYLVRMYILARQFGAEFVCQYDFRDDGYKRNYTEHNFGLVTHDWQPKPSYAAVAFMSRILADAEPLGDLSSEPDNWRCYRFRRGGKTIYAMWGIAGKCEASLPFAVDANAVAFDLMGNRIATPGVTARLEPSPVYVVQ